MILIVDTLKKVGILFFLGFLGIASAQIVKKPTDLPTDINWQTNNHAPTFASKHAIQGGTFRLMITDFPHTFREIGPNSNSSFRSYISDNNMSLVDIHPDTEEYLPALATHWSIASDNKTVFFKLNSAARWSDGRKVTADDYLFTITMMRSPHIVAPWYNNYYTKEIKSVTKYDDYTIAVSLNKAKPKEDVLLYTSLSPMPRHFHKLDKNWIQWANWKIAPNTGAYKIDTFRKGRYIDFVKVKNWWAKDLKYYKNRFNIDRIRLKVVRNSNIAWNLFLKGELDSFSLVSPEYWHERSLTKAFENGWIRKFWFYNEKPQQPRGIYLNLAEPLFNDKKVRYAIAHALNIEKLNQQLLRNDYDRLPSFNTGYGEYSNISIKPKLFDLRKANSLLESSGWHMGADGIREKNGKKLSFELIYGAALHTPRLSLLQEEMKKAGIGMRLKLLTGASHYRAIMEKTHQAALLSWGTGLRPSYHQFFHSKNANKTQTNNITNTTDSFLDQLIDRYQLATEKKERIRLAHDIQAKIADIGAYLPTYMAAYTREAAWAYVRLPKTLAPKLATNLFDPMGLGILWIDPNIRQKVNNRHKLPNQPIIDNRYQLNLTSQKYSTDSNQ